MPVEPPVIKKDFPCKLFGDGVKMPLLRLVNGRDGDDEDDMPKANRGGVQAMAKCEKEHARKKSLVPKQILMAAAVVVFVSFTRLDVP